MCKPAWLQLMYNYPGVTWYAQDEIGEKMHEHETFGDYKQKNILMKCSGLPRMDGANIPECYIPKSLLCKLSKKAYIVVIYSISMSSVVHVFCMTIYENVRRRPCLVMTVSLPCLTSKRWIFVGYFCAKFAHVFSIFYFLLDDKTMIEIGNGKSLYSLTREARLAVPGFRGKLVELRCHYLMRQAGLGDELDAILEFRNTLTKKSPIIRCNRLVYPSWSLTNSRNIYNSLMYFT